MLFFVVFSTAYHISVLKTSIIELHLTFCASILKRSHSYSVQYGRLMSNRLLTALSILRCASVSASRRTGETPSFSCSKAGTPEEPSHSTAGRLTEEEEVCSTA